nr:amidase family protein [Leucobacter exalbidus]
MALGENSHRTLHEAELRLASWNASDALSQAKRDRFGSFVAVVDELHRPLNKASRGLLEGLPFAAKDNLNTARLPTTANTPSLLGHYSNADNPVIQRVSEAGAVLIAKTNMHELALGITSGAAAFPATTNPSDPSLVAGGSSGGSAAAVASGIVPFALGTDTGGSISIPAAWCGVYGLRPTTGRWPGGGLIPLSPTRDTVGVIAASLHTLAAVDAVVTQEHGHSSAANVPMSPLRIGVPKSTSPYVSDLSENVAGAWAMAVEALSSSARVELIPVDTHEFHEIEGQCGQEIELYEISHALTRYLENAPTSVTYARLCDEAAREDVKTLLAEAFQFRNRHDEYRRARRIREQLQGRYEALFREHNICSMLYPTTPITAPALAQETFTYERGAREAVFEVGTSNLNPGSVAGQPVVTVPIANPVSPKHVGLSLEGQRNDDRWLLAVAAAVVEILALAVSPR